MFADMMCHSSLYMALAIERIRMSLIARER